MTFRLFALVMAVLIFSMPCITLAQQPHTAEERQETEQAISDAIADAQQYISSFAWVAYGFTCAIVALPHALIGEAEIPIHRLLGKSPEYVKTYTLVYQQHAKRKRLQAAAIGCGISSAISSIGTYIVYTVYNADTVW